MQLFELFAKYYKDNLSSYERIGHRYAPDLTTHKQKLLRVRNLSMRKAVQEYLKTTGEGFKCIKDDIITCEDRSNHYGKAIGESVGLIYFKSKDYESIFAKYLKQLRVLIISGACCKIDHTLN